jgi:SAM-dependent methyltransferase
MESYKGLHAGLAPGTHAALTQMITQHVPLGSGIADFGAHSGALLTRLQDVGYTDLTGFDLDETRFDVPGADFMKVDLNEDFARKIDKKFHLITTTDVIEHLDNPRHFLTEARKLLNDDGWIAISFPNVCFWEGRVKFLLKGELWGFGEHNYLDQRHISPMTFDQTLLMLQEIGFKVLSFGSSGSFATPLRWIITAPIWLPLRLIGGPKTFGESAIFVAQKSAPDPDLKRPVHYRDRWQGIPDTIGLRD